MKIKSTNDQKIEIREVGAAVYARDMGNVSPYWTTLDDLKRGLNGLSGDPEFEAAFDDIHPDDMAEEIWDESADNDEPC